MNNPQAIMFKLPEIEFTPLEGSLTVLSIGLNCNTSNK
jgi:hypothetical protein